MQRQFQTIDEIKQWLKELGKCTLLTFSLMSAGASLNANMPITPAAVEHAISAPYVHMGQGPYVVESDIDTADEVSAGSISLDNVIIAFWSDARLTATGESIGGYRELVTELSSFDHFCNLRSEELPPTGSFVIPMPSDPVALNLIKDIVAKHSLMWAFDDGSGFFTMANSYMGLGSYPLRMRG